jgi:hypothetical protein
MPMSESGQTEKNSVRAYVFRFAPGLGHCSMRSSCLKGVESRCDAIALGSNISVSAPFVWRCLTGSTMAPFSHSPGHRRRSPAPGSHRTWRAALPHHALRQLVHSTASACSFPYRFIQNQSRTCVVALKGDAAAEKSQDRLSRDFLDCSIFDFCNNICQEQPSPRNAAGLWDIAGWSAKRGARMRSEDCSRVRL